MSITCSGFEKDPWFRYDEYEVREFRPEYVNCAGLQTGLLHSNDNNNTLCRNKFSCGREYQTEFSPPYEVTDFYCHNDICGACCRICIDRDPLPPPSIVDTWCKVAGREPFWATQASIPDVPPWPTPSSIAPAESGGRIIWPDATRMAEGFYNRDIVDVIWRSSSNADGVAAECACDDGIDSPHIAGRGWLIVNGGKCRSHHQCNYNSP